MEAQFIDRSFDWFIDWLIDGQTMIFFYFSRFSCRGRPRSEALRGADLVREAEGPLDGQPDLGVQRPLLGRESQAGLVGVPGYFLSLAVAAVKYAFLLFFLINVNPVVWHMTHALDWLIDRLIVRSIDWLIDWLSNRTVRRSSVLINVRAFMRWNTCAFFLLSQCWLLLSSENGFFCLFVFSLCENFRKFDFG